MPSLSAAEVAAVRPLAQRRVAAAEPAEIGCAQAKGPARRRVRHPGLRDQLVAAAADRLQERPVAGRARPAGGRPVPLRGRFDAAAESRLSAAPKELELEPVLRRAAVGRDCLLYPS
ncbi:hypothetical protein DY468_24425, partial [Rhodopseudomonas sp. BR0M22]|nr:hypothetical protein [Rhodopseudomonas sp. BR0M22]